MKTAIIAYVVSVVMATGGAVQATIKTFQFEGTVDSVSDSTDSLQGAVQVGDTFLGFYIFETTTADQNPDPTVGDYATISPLTLDIGDLSLTSAEVGQILVFNSSFDSYLAGSYSFTDGDFEIAELFFNLTDTTSQAFSSDALPTVPPDVQLFASRSFLLVGDRNGPLNGFRISGTVTAITPEPSSFMLVVLSSMLLMGRRKSSSCRLALGGSILFLPFFRLLSRICG